MTHRLDRSQSAETQLLKPADKHKFVWRVFTPHSRADSRVGDTGQGESSLTLSALVWHLIERKRLSTHSPIPTGQYVGNKTRR